MVKQSEETVNALIQKDISYMKDDISEIKADIKADMALSATKSDLSALADRVYVIEKKLTNVQKFQYTVTGGLIVLSFLSPVILHILHITQ